MLLSELIYIFKNDYSLECLKRGVKEIHLIDKQIAIMLSKVCSNIQKKFGVFEQNEQITLIPGTDKYNLTQSFMEIKNISYWYQGDSASTRTLVQKSTDVLENQPALNGIPEIYTILFQTAVPQIWLYPNPTVADVIDLNYKLNFNLYSASQATVGDFGDYGITANGFSGNTVFPTMFDNLLLLGLMKQMFKDMELDYKQEAITLLGRQFNGQSLKEYNMSGVVKGNKDISIVDNSYTKPAVYRGI